MKFEAGLHDFEDFSPVPANQYDFLIREPMEITEDKAKKTDIGGKVFKFVQFLEISSGEFAGKRVRRQFSNATKGSRYFMKSFLEKIGVEISKTGSFSSEDLLGKKFKGTTSIRSYEKDGAPKTAAELDTESIVAL